MGNGHSIDDVFDVKGSLYECGSDQLSLDELSARTLDDNKAVTVFHYTAAPKFRDVLSTCYKYSRVLRHPKLLKVFSCNLSAGGSGLTVVTEPARPLAQLLAEGKAAIAVLHSAELAWQLHGVLEALIFLHNGQVSHNNVGEQSVFVTSDGTWKLGRLECVYPLASAAATESGSTASSGLEYLGKVSALVSTGRVPGDGGPPGVVNDVYGFSKLFERLKDRLTVVGAGIVEDFEERLTALVDEGSDLTPASAAALPFSLSSLLGHAIFRTEFQQVASFLSELCLKSEDSKTAFFRSLIPRLRALPADLVARCLVKRLLTRFIVLNQTAKRLVLPALFAPRWTPDELEQVERLNPIARRRHCSCHACAVVGVLPVSEFGTSVLVLALRLLRLHDVEARSLVLENFHAFCMLFDIDCLRTVVMPLVVRCLRDSSQVLTSLALHALADMVPLLGTEAVFSAQFLDNSGVSFPLFSNRLLQQLPAAAVASASAVPPRDLQMQTSRLPASALTYSTLTTVQSDDESSGHQAVTDDAAERHFGLTTSATDRYSKVASDGSPEDHTEWHARSKRDQSRRSGDGSGIVPAKAARTVSPPADRHIIQDSAFASSAGGSVDSSYNRLAIKDSAHPSDGRRNVKSALRLGVRMKQPVAHATNLTGSADAADANPTVLSESASATDGEMASKSAASSTKRKGFDVDGLDIKSLAIKVAQEEVDYFADMAPALAIPPPGSKPPLPRFGEHGVVSAGVRSSEFAARTSPNPSSVSHVMPVGTSLAPSSTILKSESASSAERNTNEVSGWDDGGWVDGDW